MKMDPINHIWTEKYRPKEVNKIVGDFKDKIKKYMEDPMSIPNFLFYSSAAGTGKSSLALAIVRELKCDHIIINSSSDRTMDVVRERVRDFAKSKTSKEGMKRCVVLDEVDGMRRESQEALRNTIETYATNCFFIMTANNVNKVIEPIRSRCVNIPFAYPKKEDIYKYLIDICEKENMDYTEEGVQALIDYNYPSIRNMVLVLQDMKVEGKQIIKDNVRCNDEMLHKYWDDIKNKLHVTVKKAILEGNVDPRELNKYFWEQALKEDNIRIIQLTCRNEKDFAMGCDQAVIMVTSLWEMVK